MHEKNKFTFDGDDDFPVINPDDQNEPPESALSDDDFPGTSLDSQNKSQGLDLNDNDDFPETDLNAVFVDGEHTVEESVQDEAELKINSDGNPRTRMLLMVLLLVVGAGAYYFIGLGGTKPPAPTIPAAAQTNIKTVALPPPPAEPVARISADKQPGAVINPPTIPATGSEDKVVEAKPQEEPVEQSSTKVADARQTAEAGSTQQNVAATVSAVSQPADSANPDGPVLQTAGGNFALDAGSYLLEANRDALVMKIRKLGYEPLITPVDVTLNMTRLRLGTYSSIDVQEALDLARSIEPGAYSAPAGDRFVIYAGTFLEANSVKKLSQRFLEQGVKVYPEPVQVVKTLSRVRFGSFATKDEADTAAREAGETGLKAAIVKSR
ncbi:MAG: SPOR domain-containing protein [Desulfuromonadales bacterium]|nr:SPOR domain-containing protein [Desulfuromonadales bacterium]